MVVEAALEGRAGLARDREGGGALVRDMRRAVFDGGFGRICVDGPFVARGRRVGVPCPVDGPDAETVCAVVQPRISLGRGAGPVVAIVELALEGRVLFARGELEALASVGEVVRCLGELRCRRLGVDVPFTGCWRGF